MRKKITRYFAYVTLIASVAVGVWLQSLYFQLPNAETLRDVQLQVPLRIFTSDHKLIAEYGEKRRQPVAIDEVPQQLLNAFIATEDKRFYEHSGVDFRGLMRAVVHLIKSGHKGQGGSTITMQVARNFFLSRAKTYSRKLNEILLALKIERELTKAEILELYVNKVFLGYRAYGVAAAAEVYYGKELSELTLAESAMIAGLPKAPSAINPISNPKAAKARRSHVLQRMLDGGYITYEEWLQADAEPLQASYHGTTVEVRAPYVGEMVRQQLIEQFGEDAYTMGLQVFTTIQADLQAAAYQQLRKGLLDYDQRHGLRKPRHLGEPTEWLAELAKLPNYGSLVPAVVTEVEDKSITVLGKNQELHTITWENLRWARKDLGKLRVSYYPKTAHDIVGVGDRVYIYPTTTGAWRLGQVPEVEGAIVSVSPRNGDILALVGGFDFVKSKFNRAVQAELQPGSSFKPFIYTAALANGYTPASIFNDAPIVFEDPAEEALWRPENSNRQFSGPTSLRTALIRSRNLVSIRLLRAIGLDTAIEYVTRFGFAKERMPHGLSLALGTASVAPLDMARGYAILANGGYGVDTHVIKRIEDSNGKVLLASKALSACARDCGPDEQAAPQVIDARDAYIMNTLLQDAIQRGTGRGAKSIGRTDIAGKTGTTNDQYDAWFTGFNGDAATVVWVGYDNPRSLGEYAAKAALPIWRDYTKSALKGKPLNKMAPPPGVVTVKIDPKTGFLAGSGQTGAVFEVFRVEDVPKRQATATIESSPTEPLPAKAIPEHIF